MALAGVCVANPSKRRRFVLAHPLGSLVIDAGPTSVPLVSGRWVGGVSESRSARSLAEPMESAGSPGAWRPGAGLFACPSELVTSLAWCLPLSRLLKFAERLIKVASGVRAEGCSGKMQVRWMGIDRSRLREQLNRSVTSPCGMETD